MDKYSAAIEAFNTCASTFEKRFMNLALYDKAIEEFCQLFENDHPDLLEIGCGPGNVTKRIRNHLPRASILATDAAENMIQLTKSNVPGIEYALLHTHSVTSLHKEFSGVIAAFVLPFLSYDSAALFLGDLAKVIRKNGFLYLSTMEGSVEHCGFERTSFSGEISIHFTYYSEEFLMHHLNQANFTIIKKSKQIYPVEDGEPLTDIILFAQKN